MSACNYTVMDSEIKSYSKKYVYRAALHSW